MNRKPSGFSVRFLTARRGRSRVRRKQVASWNRRRSQPRFEPAHPIVKEISLFGKKFLFGNNSSSIGDLSDRRIPKSAKLSDHREFPMRYGGIMHHPLESIGTGNRFTQSRN
jgi:hypothetical protein